MGIRDERTPARRRAETGQALVEFAIVLPILALLLTAIYQFAIIFERQIGITNAVREDARRAAALVTTDTADLVNGPNGNAQSHATWAWYELWCNPTTDTLNPCFGHEHLLHDNVQDYDSSAATLLDTQVCYTPSTANDPTGNGYATVDVMVKYAHPLFMPLIAPILDGIDGTTDDHFAVTTTVQFRVENQPNDNGITPHLSAEWCAP